ncbi:ATP-binding protein [Acidicapsa dinghuensis]|uniref:ATP-binding protein n=1 Tax=Acidicapsa dinghuensis TaxID=2218256 RepID=A0ABW1EI38_9BACT|nr:ATP-binding protein [Acidicapsa dinghuensis]
MLGSLSMEREEQLTLCSRLEDLVLVTPWVDRVVADLGLPVNQRFIIDLCLEESISNVVRHGLANDCNHSVVVRSILHEADGAQELHFVIEDDAPHFNPLAAPVAQIKAAPASIEEIAEGGRGIGLLRKYAGTLRYEALPAGNRLTIGFTLGSLS